MMTLFSPTASWRRSMLVHGFAAGFAHTSHRAGLLAMLGLGLATLFAARPVRAQQVAQWHVEVDRRSWNDRALDSVPWVRPQVRQLPSGELFILDPPARHLWRLAPDGQSLTRVARSGRGPGEIAESMSILSVRADSIAVLEQGFGPGRLSVFTREGRFVASTPIALSSGGQGSLVPFALLGADRVVVTLGGFRPLQPKVDERFRVPITVGTWSQATTAYHTIAELPGTTFIGYPSTSSGRTVTAVAAAEVAPKSEFVAARDEVVIGDSSWDSVVVVTPATGTRRTIRLPWRPAPIDPADLRRSRDAALAVAVTGADSAKAIAVHSRPATPREEPMFTSLMIGPNDELWVERFRYPSGPASRFTVLSIRTGQLLGEVTLPDGFRAHQVGEGFVVGTRTLPSGEETISRLLLRRTAR
jgi:hypothetical protein